MFKKVNDWLEKKKKPSVPEMVNIFWRFVSMVVPIVLISSAAFLPEIWDYMLLISIIIALFIWFMSYFSGIRPWEEKIVELKTQLSFEDQKLDKCKQFNNELERELHSWQEELTKYRIKVTKREDKLAGDNKDKDLDSIQKDSQIVLFNKRISELEEKIEARKSELEELEIKVLQPRKTKVTHPDPGKGDSNLCGYEKKGDKVTFPNLSKVKESPKKEILKKLQGIDTLKVDIRDLQKKAVEVGYFPVAGSLISLCGFTLFLIVSIFEKILYNGALKAAADKANIALKSGELIDIFGKFIPNDLTYAVLGAVVIVAAAYLSKSFLNVATDEKALKLFLGRPYAERGPGLAFVLYGLVTIKRFKISVRPYNIKEDTAMSVGEDSQPIILDASVLWKVTNTWDASIHLGTSMDQVIEKVEGTVSKEDKEDGDDKKRKDRGFLPEYMLDLIRGHIADPVLVSKLDDALMLRKRGLASWMETRFNDEFGHMGITVTKVNIPGVDPVEEIQKALKEKAKAKIDVGKAEIQVKEATHKASAVREKAAGDADAKVKLGDADAKVKIKLGNAEAEVKKKIGSADANVTIKIGKAEAKAILMKFQADADAVKYLKEQGIKEEWVLGLLSLLLMGEKTLTEVTKSAAGMKFNLLAVPGFEEMFKKLIGMVPSKA